MIRSMTGYGKAVATLPGRKVTVEVRSLNSKQLDLALRLPARYRPLESEIRLLSSRRIQRGKADLSLSVEWVSESESVGIDEHLFRAYRRRLGALAEQEGLRGEAVDAALLQAVLHMPEVVANEENPLDEAEREAVMRAVGEAMDGLDAFRMQEGEVLIRDLLGRIDRIEALRDEVAPFEAERVGSIRDRLRDALTQLAAAVDPSRLEQEMIFYLEKLDITEEKVRLENHCRYFREVAEGEEAPGRKLGFIAQEMGREINTLGSKASDSRIQRIVVQMKDELEKIKEQVLNLL